MKSFEEIKESEKRRFTYAVQEVRKHLDDARSDNDKIIYSKKIQRYLDNLENLDEVTINIIAHECKDVIRDMQRIHDIDLHDYYSSRFESLIKFHFGNTYTDDGYGKAMLSSGSHRMSGPGTIVDLDDIIKCFQGKNPNNKEVIEEFINYVNDFYGIELISDDEFEKIEREYEKNSENDKIYIEYIEAKRNAGKMGLAQLLKHDDRYVQAKEKISGRSL